MSLPPTPLTGAMARHGAVAPIQLLDVLDYNGYSYHWSSESIPSASARGISPIYTGNPPPWNSHLMINPEQWDNVYLNWLLESGPFHLSRSQLSDIGNFIIQNMSGDSLSRSMNKIITATAFEGALFAFRIWNLDAQAVQFEMHGHLTLIAVSETVAEFHADQLFNPSDYQGLQLYSETCPWRYASAACGDTTNNPCQQSWQTCRQPSRFGGIVLTVVSVSPPGSADVSTRDVVRNRQV